MIPAVLGFGVGFREHHEALTGGGDVVVAIFLPATKEKAEARLLTAHGTLYRALSRFEKAGLLESRWEDPVVAAEENRPRRRLYRVTAAGEAALAEARAATTQRGRKGSAADEMAPA